jgi:hypothetical protein
MPGAMHFSAKDFGIFEPGTALILGGEQWAFSLPMDLQIGIIPQNRSFQLRIVEFG